MLRRRGGFVKVARRPVRKVGRKVVRTARLVNGRSPFSAMEQVYKAGGNAIPYIIRGYNQIRSLINTEPKFLLLNAQTPTSPSSAGDTTHLSGIAQGSDEQQRNGNRILCKDLYMDLNFSKHASATETFLRCIIYVDKENRGATPSTTDVLESASYASMKNVDNTRRFTTLYDKVFKLTTQFPITHLKKFFKLPFHMDFSGTGAPVANAKENHVFMLLISSEATNTPVILYSSKLSYYDN